MQLCSFRTMGKLLWPGGHAVALAIASRTAEPPPWPMGLLEVGAHTHTHTHRSPTRTGPCTLNAVGLLSSRRGVARAALALSPTALSVVWRSVPGLT